MPDGPRRNGPRYDEDFYAWTQYQGEVLRTLRTRDNRFDRENVAEEIEAVGRNERDAVRSQVRRILEHFLKLASSPATAPRYGWIDSILDARAVLADKISPTLHRDIEAALPNLYRDARRKTEISLRGHGEPEAAGRLPTTCPFTFEQVLADDWYPPPPEK